MAYLENEFYHIYNQGNNKVTLFHSHDHYICFLAKVREFIKPNGDIMACCLMPNHYHFLILTNEKSVQMKKVGSLYLSALSNGVRVLTSSYARALNKQSGNTGTLFRPKTNYKRIDNGQKGYLQTLSGYIQQNPLVSGLVDDLGKWPYSSYPDYKGLRNGTLCNIEPAGKYIEF